MTNTDNNRRRGEIALLLTVIAGSFTLLGILTGVIASNRSQDTRTKAATSETTRLKTQDQWYTCPTTSTQVYQSIGVNPRATPPHPQPNAAGDPDINLSIRGYTPTTNTLNLIEVGGPQDTLAPQLLNLLASKRVPTFLSAAQVYDWDWSKNQKGGKVTDPPVTLLGLEAIQGEAIKLPNSGYKIDTGRNLQAMVLYATESQLTVKYTTEDNIVDGYGFHFEDICVDPNLLTAYRSADTNGRSSLPALSGDQVLGYAKSNEVKLAIRDKGSFMDPRVRKSWWQSATTTPGPSPTVSSTNPTTTQAECLAGSTGRISITQGNKTYRLCTGNTYSSGIDIQTNNVTLDGTDGAVITGTTASTIGVSIDSRSNVSIKNVRITGFLHGLSVKNSSSITIDGGDYSGNSKGGSDQDLLATLMDKTETGGGILFDSVTNSKILNSKATGNIAGVSVFRSSNVEVNGGDYSNNTGWGLRFITTTDSKIIGTRAVNNNRINSQCPKGGCESAGILLMQNSHRNRIENNTLDNGGDGFYINGNSRQPSNNNIILGNSSRSESKYSSGNGFEATFSEGNIFQNNVSSGQNYGFWLGFSEKSVLLGNDSRAVEGGISIPASKCNAMINNTSQNGNSSKNHIFPEQQDLGGKSKECRDNYVATNNSPQINVDTGCTNTSSSPIAACSLSLTPVPTSSQTPTGNPTPTGSSGGTNPTPTTTSGNGNPTPTTGPGNGNGNGNGTTLKISIYITKNGQRRLWTAADGKGKVYIKGPTARGGFSVVMDIPTTTNQETCTDTEGHTFRCSPGVIYWAGAGNTQDKWGTGTSPGSYSIQIADLPSGLAPTPYPNPAATAVSGQTTNVSLEVVSGTWNGRPGTTPSVSPTVASTGYTNQDFQKIIDLYTREGISALSVSLWLTNATRIPGLQNATCYPPGCEIH